jgi:hypothetical protein
MLLSGSMSPSRQIKLFDITAFGPDKDTIQITVLIGSWRQRKSYLNPAHIEILIVARNQYNIAACAVTSHSKGYSDR